MEEWEWGNAGCVEAEGLGLFYLIYKLDAQSSMVLILVGQSELWERLRLQSYAAIRQRIDFQFKLRHYDRAQVGKYIKRHHDYAGVEQKILSDGALDEIHCFSYKQCMYTYSFLWSLEWSSNNR
jgi:type II secretory pathway predicted ATPase ExeA